MPTTPTRISFPKRIIYRFKDKCQVEDLTSGCFIDIVSVKHLLAVSSVPELVHQLEGTSFLVLHAGNSYETSTGQIHWYFELMAKDGFTFSFTSKNPMGVDKVKIFRAAVPIG